MAEEPDTTSPTPEAEPASHYASCPGFTYTVDKVIGLYAGVEYRARCCGTCGAHLRTYGLGTRTGHAGAPL